MSDLFFYLSIFREKHSRSHSACYFHPSNFGWVFTSFHSNFSICITNFVLPISLPLSLFLLLIVPSLSLRLFPSVSLLPLSGSLSLFSSVLLSLLLLFLSSFSFLTQCSLSTIIAPQGSWFPHTVQFSNPTSFICF